LGPTTANNTIRKQPCDIYPIKKRLRTCKFLNPTPLPVAKENMAASKLSNFNLDKELLTFICPNLCHRNFRIRERRVSNL
jgi:hypothetical protein